MKKTTPNDNLFYLLERKCPICGKNFIPAPEHIYRYRKQLFCKWTCYRSFLRQNEERPKNYHSRVVEMIDQSGAVLRTFESSRIAAESLGYKEDSIRACCRKETPFYKGYVWRYAGECQND